MGWADFWQEQKQAQRAAAEARWRRQQAEKYYREREAAVKVEVKGGTDQSKNIKPDI